jgi:hypothetical protein
MVVVLGSSSAASKHASLHLTLVVHALLRPV